MAWERIVDRAFLTEFRSIEGPCVAASLTGTLPGIRSPYPKPSLVFLDPSRQMECAFLMQTQCRTPSCRPGLLLKFTG